MVPDCRCGKQPPHQYNETVIFIRADVFYPVTGTACEDWAKHAELNPGTLAIETIGGDRLWPEGTQQ